MAEGPLYPEWDGPVHYYPQFGEQLASGKLKIPVCGLSETDGHWDGFIEVGPGHPNYALWLQAIGEKQRILAEMAEERRREREARRRKRRA